MPNLFKTDELLDDLPNEYRKALSRLIDVLMEENMDKILARMDSTIARLDEENKRKDAYYKEQYKLLEERTRGYKESTQREIQLLRWTIMVFGSLIIAFLGTGLLKLLFPNFHF